MLGGIFLFCIQLSEPFFSVKLKVIESSRLQHKSSSALVNQVCSFSYFQFQELQKNYNVDFDDFVCYFVL